MTQVSCPKASAQPRPSTSSPHSSCAPQERREKKVLFFIIHYVSSHRWGPPIRRIQVSSTIRRSSSSSARIGVSLSNVLMVASEGGALEDIIKLYLCPPCEGWCLGTPPLFFFSSFSSGPPVLRGFRLKCETLSSSIPPLHKVLYKMYTSLLSWLPC